MAQDKRLVLKAKMRKKLGKNANKRLRAAGEIPAVFYSGSDESIPVKINELEINRVYAQVGRTSLIDLVIEDSDPKVDRACLIWDVEYHPTQERFQHIDFYGVDLDRVLRVRVPLNFIGTPKGINQGGKLAVLHEFIFVDTKADTLPSEIDVDVTDLELDDDIRIEELTMPEGVVAIYDDNYPVANIYVPELHDEILEDELAAEEAAELEEGEEADGEEHEEGEEAEGSEE